MFRRFIILILYLAPLAYSGALLAVAVHEVLGHGVTALLLGGRCSGFVLRLDVMGFAMASPAPDAPMWRQVAVLSGGVISTTIFGTAFLLLALRLRTFPFLRMALAVLASCFALNGSLYMLWNSFQPKPPGDIGRIIRIVESDLVRWMIFAISGALTVLFVIVPMSIVVRESNRWLQVDSKSRMWKRAIMPVVLGGAFGVGQCAFDWNQIAFGIGATPRVCGAAVAVMLSVILMRVPTTTSSKISEPRFPWAPISCAWISVAMLIGIIWNWTQPGLRW